MDSKNPKMNEKENETNKGQNKNDNKSKQKGKLKSLNVLNKRTTSSDKKSSELRNENKNKVGILERQNLKGLRIQNENSKNLDSMGKNDSYGSDKRKAGDIVNDDETNKETSLNIKKARAEIKGGRLGSEIGDKENLKEDSGKFDDTIKDLRLDEDESDFIQSKVTDKENVACVDVEGEFVDDAGGEEAEGTRVDGEDEESGEEASVTVEGEIVEDRSMTENAGNEGRLDKLGADKGTDYNNEEFYRLVANNRYDENDKGPFVVVVDAREVFEDNNKGQENRIALGNILIKNGCCNHVNIMKIGSFKFKVTTKTARDANEMVVNFGLKQIGLKIFIPTNMINTEVIIKEVPVDLPNEEILANIKHCGEIINVKRLKRMNYEKNRLVDTQNVVLTFVGKEIPKYISIYGARYETKYYIPAVKKCLKCLKYGHRTKYCKANFKRCTVCAESECREEGLHEYKCFSCGGAHMTFSKECEEWTYQVELQKVMVIGKLSKEEAERLLGKNCSDCNRDTRGFQLSEEEFPALVGNENILKEKKNHIEEVNKIICKRKSRYRRVWIEKLRTNTSFDREMAQMQNEYSMQYGQPVFENQLYKRIEEYEKVITFLINAMEKLNKTHKVFDSNELSQIKKRFNKSNIELDVELINNLSQNLNENTAN